MPQDSDERGEQRFTEAQIQAKITERRVKTIGGVVIGVVGIVVGVVAALWLEHLGIAALGFGGACVGWGVARPEQFSKIRLFGGGKR